jgi:DNA adenine methylase
MQYLGGKSKLAKRIVAELPLQWADEVLEPFMGGGAITAELARNMRAGQVLVASDVLLPLRSMWMSALSGWEPTRVTEESYRQCKELPDSDPLKAFAGFGCSFGGRWFNGFARSSKRDHSDESRRNLKRWTELILSSSATVEIECRSFFDIKLPSDPKKRLIYCDPPYFGTEGYVTGKFPHELFWKRCREMVRSGARVYVSEFRAPGFAKPVLKIERPIAVSGKGNHSKRIDTLFEVQP